MLKCEQLKMYTGSVPPAPLFRFLNTLYGISLVFFMFCPTEDLPMSANCLCVSVVATSLWRIKNNYQLQSIIIAGVISNLSWIWTGRRIGIELTSRRITFSVL